MQSLICQWSVILFQDLQCTIKAQRRFEGLLAVFKSMGKPSQMLIDQKSASVSRLSVLESPHRCETMGLFSRELLEE